MLDITLDLETCALCPTAAVMSIGAVAWDRFNVDTPFIPLQKEFPDTQDPSCFFSCHIDLRSMYVNNFTFDKKTSEWWKCQSDDAKASVLGSDSYELPCRPIEVAIKDLFDWAEELRQTRGEDKICLWSQGSDFDIAILRNICYVFNIDIPVHYTNFRDHRTYYLEGARRLCEAREVDFDQRYAYELVDDYTEGKDIVHDPMYDCKRSIYATWQMMKKLKCLKYPED